MWISAGRSKGVAGPARQRGAALFVALMVLILLSLLALSAAQVTALQERMAGIYRADALAFHTAEKLVRRAERVAISNPLNCDNAVEPALPANWLDGTASQSASRTENLAQSMLFPDSSGFGQSQEPGSTGCTEFRVSGFGFDDDTGKTSRAINQTTYIL